MADFTYRVTVTTETREIADQVMVERINVDEDYGIGDYQIMHAPVEYGYSVHGVEVYEGWTKDKVLGYITGHIGYSLISRDAS